MSRPSAETQSHGFPATLGEYEQDQLGVGMTLLAVNAGHIKAVEGRKTDGKDAEWIADLLRHGLLRTSFIPDRGQRELGELVR